MPPRDATPSCFRCSSVRLGRTVSSISFSRNAASYFPRPRLRSQTTMSIVAPRNQGWRTSSAGAANVSRVVLAGLRASQSPLRSGLFDFSQKQIWFSRCSS